MNKTTSSLTRPVFRSCIPLFVGSGCYILKEILRYSSHIFQESSNSFLNASETQHENLNRANPSNILAGFFGLLSEISFEIYSNFLAFLFVMLLIEIISRILRQGTDLGLKSTKSLALQDLKPTLKKVWSQVFLYTLIFIVFQTAGSTLSFINKRAILAISSPSITPMSFDHQENSFHLTRILEEEEKEEKIIVENSIGMYQQQTPSLLSPVTPIKSEKISLSMGKILSSLNIHIAGLALSKDQRYAFVTIAYYGTLKIIDLANLQSPVIVGSLALQAPDYTYRMKTLLLSKDEKTLFLCSELDLEIIDVTDLKSPKRLSLVNSETFEQISRAPLYWRISLAFDERTKTLFIGGIGLQVLDVSNLTQPVLLKEFMNNSSQSLERNEICLSHDGQVLLIANGTLDIYNISNPKEMKLINSFSSGSSARSLYRSRRSENVVFLLGENSASANTTLQKVDLSNYKSPMVMESYSTGLKSTYNSRILALSPGETQFYLWTVGDLKTKSLEIFDFNKRSLRNDRKFIESSEAMIFSTDGRSLITDSNDGFLVIELFLDYPNSEVFGSSIDVLSNLPMMNDHRELLRSANGKTLFLLSVSIYTYFEVWDIEDLKAPKILSQTRFSKEIFQMSLRDDEKTVYLIGGNKILIGDISDKVHPKFTEIQQHNNLLHFGISPDEKIGFLVSSDWDTKYLSMFYVSDLIEKKQDLAIWSQKLPDSDYKGIIKDESTLIMLEEEIRVYDVSNIEGPILISSLPYFMNESTPLIRSYVLSPDKKTLFIEAYNLENFYKLQIYDVSERASPKFISEKAFSRFKSERKLAFSLSLDGKTGFVFQDHSLVKVDLTDLEQPRISGVIPLAIDKEDKVLNYILSPDSKTIFLATESGIVIFNSNIRHTLFLRKEKFLLGEKYSDNVAILVLNGTSDYSPMERSSYKIMKLSLFNMKVREKEDSLQITTSALPSWITFDGESNTLTVEPKRQSDIGKYTFHAGFSRKIPMNAFSSLEDPEASDILLAWLRSLDYIDNELFLTSKFGSLETFILPPQFKKHKSQIYDILREFYLETCTNFGIISSLSLKDTLNRLEVSTLNVNDVRVDIKLIPKANSEAYFVSKPYASLLPIIKEKKSLLEIEGTMKEINAALQTLVVDFSGEGSSCDATITISDGLNPIRTFEVNDFSRYVQENQQPKLNLRLQEQIDGGDVYTGRYFTISLKDDTFIDQHWNASLTYKIERVNNKEPLPDWLSMSELTLRGIPPEEILGRNIDLILVAKNEFKEYRVGFQLNVKISTMFFFKLLLRFSPYILTIIGVLLNLIKIFNIFGERWYQHLKEYKVGVGKEISPKDIFPISFIGQELRQSRVILKHLLDQNHLETFIDQSGVLEKQRIVDVIQEAINRMPNEEREKIKYQPLVEQIIMNKFVMIQLNSEKEHETKKLFDELKSKCVDLVEYNDSERFTVNQDKLNKLLDKKIVGKDNETLEESLIKSEINMELLKDAIEAYVFEEHSVDISPISVDIVVRQKVLAGFLMRLLKLDMKQIFFNERSKIDYGLNYKINGGKLCFYGVVHKDFENTTIAVQIKNSRTRILKEIWIHGVSENQKLVNRSLVIRNESETQGQSYEIF